MEANKLGEFVSQGDLNCETCDFNVSSILEMRAHEAGIRHRLNDKARAAVLASGGEWSVHQPEPCPPPNYSVQDPGEGWSGASVGLCPGMTAPAPPAYGPLVPGQMPAPGPGYGYGGQISAGPVSYGGQMAAGAGGYGGQMASGAGGYGGQWGQSYGYGVQGYGGLGGQSNGYGGQGNGYGGQAGQGNGYGGQGQQSNGYGGQGQQGNGYGGQGQQGAWNAHARGPGAWGAPAGPGQGFAPGMNPPGWQPDGLPVTKGGVMGWSLKDEDLKSSQEEYKPIPITEDSYSSERTEDKKWHCPFCPGKYWSNLVIVRFYHRYKVKTW